MKIWLSESTELIEENSKRFKPADVSSVSPS